jgi:RNA polymerase sigma factor (sigma-70 family)
MFAVMEVVKKYTDDELLAAIQLPQGVDDAIKFMYREYYESSRIYICQNSGNDEDAQDIFQEMLVAFIRLVQNNKFRGESSIKTFLYAMNRNIWLNELKKRGRAERRDTIFETEKEKEVADVSYFIAQAEMQKSLFSVIETLGETCKKILLAFYYDNLSMKEILTTLDYESEQAVRNKKCKCLKKLEELITNNPSVAKILKTALNYE